MIERLLASSHTLSVAPEAEPTSAQRRNQGSVRRLRGDGQHELPAYVAALAELVRALHVEERHRLSDLHANVSTCHEVGYPRELLRLGAHHEQLGAHPALPRGVLRWSVCDSDEHSALAHGREQRGGRVATDGVEREVGAAHRLAHLLLGVVDVLVGTQAQREVAVPRGAGADHPRARHLGELHSEMAYPADGSRHESRLPTDEPALVEEGLPSGEAGDRYRRGLLVTDALRLPRNRRHGRG